jgi:hypothetical protein
MSRYVDTAGHPIEQHVLVDSSGSLVEADDTDGQALIFTKSRNYVWDTGTLAWVRETQPGGGGGGGASTIADGADVAEGTTTDVKVVGDNQGTVSAKLRGINTALAGTLNVSAVQSGTWNVGTLTSITNAIDVSDRTTRLLGHVTVDNASLAVTQSGAWSVALNAGSNVIGHVIVDSGAITDSGTVTSNQGTAASFSNPWPVGQSFGGLQIDPRSIRALASTDTVTTIGPFADNTVATTTLYPIIAAGVDNTNTVRALLTDAQGTLLVLHRFEIFEELLTELKKHTLALSLLAGEDVTDYEF